MEEKNAQTQITKKSNLLTIFFSITLILIFEVSLIMLIRLISFTLIYIYIPVRKTNYLILGFLNNELFNL